MNKLFLLALFFVSVAFLCSYEVNIGSGTSYNGSSSSPSPYANYFKNERDQYLVTATELNLAGGGAGPITAIGFNVFNTNACQALPNYTIKLGHTTQSTLSTTFITGLNIVKVDSLYQPVQGWNMHELDSLFVWDGISNLAIEVIYSMTDVFSNNASVYFTSTSPHYRALYYRNDINNAANVISGSISFNRPNLRFDMTEFASTAPPSPAFLISPDDDMNYLLLGTTLNWATGGGNPTGYKIYLGTDGDGIDQPSDMLYGVDLLTLTSLTPNLSISTTYYWQIVPYNENGDAVNCPIWSFTTAPEQYYPIGKGNLIQRLPFGIYSGFERSAAIYTANQIGAVGNVVKLAWYCQTPDTNLVVPYKIYAKQTSETQLTPQPWGSIIADAYLLKTGNIIFASKGWHIFELDTPFPYATDNILIGIETYYGGNGSGNALRPVFRYTAGTENRHQFWAANNNPPLGNGTVNSFMPNLVLNINPFPALPVLHLNPDAWNFGNIVLNKSSAMSFRISNFGTSPLYLQDIIVSGDYYNLLNDPTPLELALGESVVIIVNYSPVSVGEHNGFVSIISVDSTGVIELTAVCYDPVIMSFPWFEGFESYTFPPTEWNSIDSDADNYKWIRYSSNPYFGVGCAASASWTASTGALSPDNWLITPPLLIPDIQGMEAIIEWYVAAHSPSFFDEHCGIYVSTTYDNPSDFTLLFDETMTDNQWQYRAETLAEYAGQRIFIAFRHFNSFNQNYLKIDNLRVRILPILPVTEITPLSWDAGEITFLNPVTQKFTIKNTGTGIININPFDIFISDDMDGCFTLNVTDLPVSLSILRKIEFTVQFHPLTLGQKTANLNIQDNLNGRIIHQIPLSGNSLPVVLSRPLNFQLEIVNDNVLLSWDHVLNAEKYVIYKSSDPLGTYYVADSVYAPINQHIIPLSELAQDSFFFYVKAKLTAPYERADLPLRNREHSPFRKTRN